MHTGGGGGGGVAGMKQQKHPPPRQIFEKLLNKHANNKSQTRIRQNLNFMILARLDSIWQIW
jgi:hypothetical protein